MMVRSLWKNEHYVTIYTLARSGLSEIKIAKALGISLQTFRNWRAKDPAIRDALKRGRTSAEGQSNVDFKSFVYGRLPARLQKLWSKLMELDEDVSGLRKAEVLLEDAGKNARQHLFLYALVAFNFNPSEACRRVNIGRSTVHHWMTTDPDFAALVHEINEHKGNFFEAALTGLVAKGDVAATIFANRTFNRERGYGDKVDVTHSGTIEQNVNLIPIQELDLPVEVRKAIVAAMRERDAKQARLIENKSA